MAVEVCVCCGPWSMRKLWVALHYDAFVSSWLLSFRHHVQHATVGRITRTAYARHHQMCTRWHAAHIRWAMLLTNSP